MSLTEALKTKKINLKQIINLIVLVVAGLIAINIYNGQNRKVAQIVKDQNELKEKNQVLLRIGDLKKGIVLYKEALKQKDRREIINAITNLATDAGVKIISLRPQERRVPGGWTTRTEDGSEVQVYDKTFFELTIQTDGYHQLGKFISGLENDQIMFIIESLRLKGISTGIMDTKELAAQSNKLEVELTISELFFIDS